MKYKIIIIILLFLFIGVNAKSLPLKNKIIYIDPGHGGVDNGTSYKELYEKEINLNVSLKLKKVLEQYGAKVYLTRNGDYDLAKPYYTRRKLSDLSNRVKMINESKADIYLSLHTNYFENSSYNGLQVFYSNINENNIKIAQLITKEIKTNRSIKIIENKYMYDLINIPGVLIEIGFLSNPIDRNNLQNDEYLLELSKKISKGIIKYMSNL